MFTMRQCCSRGFRETDTSLERDRLAASMSQWSALRALSMRRSGITSPKLFG